jgi:hypothetical protein
LARRRSTIRPWSSWRTWMSSSRRKKLRSSRSSTRRAPMDLRFKSTLCQRMRYLNREFSSQNSIKFNSNNQICYLILLKTPPNSSKSWITTPR